MKTMITVAILFGIVYILGLFIYSICEMIQLYRSNKALKNKKEVEVTIKGFYEK